MIVNQKKFSIGDRVKYTSGVYGDSPHNPLFGGKCGRIYGVVTRDFPMDYHVEWDNKTCNSYYENDLEKVFYTIPPHLFDID